MAKIMSAIGIVQERLNPELRIVDIVIMQFNRRKPLNKSVSELIRESFCKHVFDTVIRENVSSTEVPIKGTSIFEYSSSSHGAKDYMLLAKEIMKKLKYTVMGKGDLLKDSMKGEQDGQLTSTMKSRGGGEK